MRDETDSDLDHHHYRGYADDDPGATFCAGKIGNEIVCMPERRLSRLIHRDGIKPFVTSVHAQLVIFAAALFAANTINVGADLAGMSDAAGMLARFNSHWFVVLFGIAIAYSTVHFRYFQIAKTLKWLALFLFAYVIMAFAIQPDWRAVLHDTFVPSLPKGYDAWQNLVAILGTTISPYLFFLQASVEVEEDKAIGRRMLRQREG